MVHVQRCAHGTEPAEGKYGLKSPLNMRYNMRETCAKICGKNIAENMQFIQNLVMLRHPPISSFHAILRQNGVI